MWVCVTQVCCLFYTITPEAGKKAEGGKPRQWQQPAGFLGPPHPGPQSSEPHKGGSVPVAPTAHIRAACLSSPPSFWAWQQHWVIQPQAGDNDHTVGSHTCCTAE